AAAGIELTEHVIEEDDRVIAERAAEIAGLGQAHGERRGALLRAGSERIGGPAIDLDEDVVPVRPYERGSGLHLAAAKVGERAQHAGRPLGLIDRRIAGVEPAEGRP